MVARLLGIGRARRKPRRAPADPGVTATAVEDLQNRLQQHLATHVTIHHSDKRGRIEIEYYRTNDLQRIVTALGLPEPQGWSGGVLEECVRGGNYSSTPLLHWFC